MLTGDKVGTAKNIATACNILPATAELTRRGLPREDPGAGLILKTAAAR